MFTFEPYEDADGPRWDSFIAGSRNGTFLFQRGYMDYHRDRFQDASLLIGNEGGLIAVLPASRSGDKLVSHGGLTYGGLVVDDRMTSGQSLALFQALAEHLAAAGVGSLLYKTIPSIYHRVPTEEDLYALFRLDARLVRRDVLSVIDNRTRLPFQERRRRGAKKAAARNMIVSESGDWAGFWNLLAARLDEKYGTRPVHSVEEIRLLAERFPGNIRLFTCSDGPDMMSGVVIYDTGQVAHAQYIAASEEGRQNGAQDLLFDRLIATFAERRWFDFGISNEQNGHVLNEGLAAYKEGFGARTIVHDFYELSLV